MSAVLFGLNVSTSAAPGADPVADATKAEDLGFDFVSASDHLHGGHPAYEPWTMLSWVAAATSRIRVATRVLAVPYRPPAVLAKMAESFDRLSGGRLILGLGGGFSDEEFRAFGLGVRPPRDKVDGMEEAVRIVRGLWSQRSFTFEGRLYRTEGAEVEPKPDRRIPIWLGTYGNRALAVTGRLADGWIPSLGFAPPERVTAMRARPGGRARGGPRARSDHLRLQPRGPGGRARRGAAVRGVGLPGSRGGAAPRLRRARLHRSEPDAGRGRRGRAGPTPGPRGHPRSARRGLTTRPGPPVPAPSSSREPAGQPPASRTLKEPLALPGDLQPHRRAGRGVLDRVDEQVLHDPLDLRRVHPD